MNQLRRPDGIEQRHIRKPATRLYEWPVGLMLFTLVILTAGLGTSGKHDALAGRAAGVHLSIVGPARIRSGEYFEMLFDIQTEREIGDAVLAISPDIWHDVTVNTMIPQPTDERFEDGAFRFHFGRLGPGSRLLVKVDGQINPAYPPGANEGTVEILDRAVKLVRVGYEMKVFP